MPSRSDDTIDADSVWLDEEAQDADHQHELDLAFEEEVADRLRVMRESVEGALSAAIQVWAAPPKRTVSQWADEKRYLSPEASAEPGRWMTSRAEYAREIMDAFNDPSATTVVFMASSQVSKTEILLNVIGYVIEEDPGPMLVLQPTKEMAKAFSEERLQSMLRDSPSLAKIVAPEKSRSSRRATYKVSFPGGHISLVGANAPAGLASRPIRVVLADEIDRYPPSAKAEGDPLSLAIKRTTTFWNKKIIIVSTPTIKGHSRIEKAFAESDQRKRFCKCPECEHKQVLKWAQVRWENNDPDTAAYVCEGCGVMWNDAQRWKAVSQGEWVATAPFRGTIGFHVNQLVSPWVTLAETVREFLTAKRGGIQQLKTFVNTVLGESWEEQGERVDDNELLQRRVDYGDVAPAPVIVVTAGVDVQADRIEAERVGWAANDQSFGLGKAVLWGDPTGPDVWRQLDELLQEPILREGGTPLTVKAAAVDSKYLTQTVANWCRDRWGRRVWAINGVSGEGKPIWPKKPGKREKSRLPFFNVGVDSAKDVVYARLRVTDPNSPGYCWFNMSYDEEQFNQLTAEEVVTTYVKGMPVRRWQKKPGCLRNESLDVRAYAYAALEGLKMMGLKLKEEAAAKPSPDSPVARKAKQAAEEPQPEQTAPQTAPPPPTPAPERPRVIRKKKGRRIVGGI